jgi:hypothetical protein
MPLLPEFSPADYTINWNSSHLNTIAMLPDLIFPVLDLPIQHRVTPVTAQGTLPTLFCGNPCYCYRRPCEFASRWWFGRCWGGRKRPVVLVPVKSNLRAGGEGDEDSYGIMGRVVGWFARCCGRRKKVSLGDVEAVEESVEVVDETTPLLGGQLRKASSAYF